MITQDWYQWRSRKVRSRRMCCSVWLGYIRKMVQFCVLDLVFSQSWNRAPVGHNVTPSTTLHCSADISINRNCNIFFVLYWYLLWQSELTKAPGIALWVNVTVIQGSQHQRKSGRIREKNFLLESQGILLRVRESQGILLWLRWTKVQSCFKCTFS